MRKFLTLALAAACLAGYASSSFAGVGGAVAAHAPAVSLMTKAEWRDCREWDRDRRECRDRDWDRHHNRNWYGIRSCRLRGHDHFIGEDGHWHECPRRGGY
jgi:hypothetical protein